jgi:hypothetical protein
MFWTYAATGFFAPFGIAGTLPLGLFEARKSTMS